MQFEQDLMQFLQEMEKKERESFSFRDMRKKTGLWFVWPILFQDFLKWRIRPDLSDDLIWKSQGLRGLGWSQAKNKSFSKLNYLSNEPKHDIFRGLGRKLNVYKKDDYLCPYQERVWEMSGFRTSNGHELNMKVPQHDLIYPLNPSRQFFEITKIPLNFLKSKLGLYQYRTWSESSQNFLKLPKHYFNL